MGYGLRCRLTIRYRKSAKGSAVGRVPYYIDGSARQPDLKIPADLDIGVVRQLTRPEKLPALPLTSQEFVKAFTSHMK
jgi:hypothetical protein